MQDSIYTVVSQEEEDMSIWNKINETSKQALHKTSLLLEEKQIRSRMHEEEKQLSEYLRAIGDIVLAKYPLKEYEDERINDLCERALHTKAAMEEEQVMISSLYRQDSIVKCPYCGGEVDERVNFCHNCGHRL